MARAQADTDESKIRSLDGMAEKYLKERSSRKSAKSRDRDTGIFKHLLAFFGPCSLSNMSARRINDYKVTRLAKVDGQTVKKELGVLRNAFNVAIREWEWVKDNPVSRASMPKDPPGRVRYLTGQEIDRLLECAEKWFRPVLLWPCIPA